MAGPSGLDRLWAPWRMSYIRGAEESSAARSTARAAGPSISQARGTAGGNRGAKATRCLFCRVREMRNDRADLVLARRRHAFLMLNRFPYNPAHMMVAVARHAARFTDLEPEEQRELLDLTALAERALAAEYRPEGINYGANVGRVAGAGYPGHLHLHLVPRWNGDTNFMPTIGSTKVLPESLGSTWKRLRSALSVVGTPPLKVPGATRGRRR